MKIFFTTFRNILRPSVTGAIVLLTLGACDTTSRVTDYFTKPEILACPDYRILADASVYMTHRPGPGRDLIDVDYEGTIDNMRLGCTTRRNKKTKIGIMEIDVVMDILAQRGPANRNQKAEFPYFISVTDLNKKVLYREEFKIAVSFAGNRTGIGITSAPIILELPLKPRLTGKDYIIYSGFKLSREQLESNRQRRKEIIR